MAKDKQKEEKVVLEREYIIPLRKRLVKVQRYRRANKAIKTIKEFIVRHMKIYDRDLSKVKIDKYLNEEIWFRGIKKPPAKIKVKAKKFDSGIVRVELGEIPDVIRFKMEREERKKRVAEKAKEKAEEKKEKEEEKSEEEKKEEKEKEKASVEAGLKEQKKRAKEIKHEVAEKKIKKPVVRKALMK